MAHSTDSSSSETTPSTSPATSLASLSSSPSDFTPRAVLEAPRFHVFHVQAPRDHHKLFVSTCPQPILGFFFYIMHIPSLMQPLMILGTDVIESIQPLAAIDESKLVGSIAAPELDRLKALVHAFGVPLTPSASDPPDEDLRRAEHWVQDLVELLLDDGILQTPPPPPAAPPVGRQLPRHHHTAHCIHQRLHSHHPYRRRGRQPVLNNSLVNPSPPAHDR
ncbi:hypothetical protein FALBO_4241 [Fusarium albosuccineum]|uniref:Uncharacterized protein n=1 Tax=Fusarium albosuccineum TaxID=1237068 RepID=A0A8H4PGJ8_9HYPO|nr:hypothetical protein FALBO_4241 [Fusarium albosuccineum]